MHNPSSYSSNDLIVLPLTFLNLIFLDFIYKLQYELVTFLRKNGFYIGLFKDFASLNLK